MRPVVWQLELARATACIAGGAGAGAIAGHTLAGALTGCLALFAWHAWHAHRHLTEQSVSAPPGGLWNALGAAAAHSQREVEAARQNLQTLRRNFDAAGEVYPDPLIQLDRQLAVEWCNPAAENLLGFRASDVAGRPLTDVLRHPVLTEFLLEQDASRTVEIAAPVDKGRLLSLQRFSFGAHGRQLLVARDITRVHNLDAARRDFVANVSHELRTPLTVISGYLEALADTLQNDPEWTDPIALMKLQATRMDDLIKDLTELMRLESQDPRDIEQFIPVTTLIDEIVDEARALSGDRRHTFEVHADRSLTLRGNRQQIRSALSNLVFNAVQHTTARTEVVVSWQRDESGARLTVADNGKGIAARHLPRLTERFYRADPGRARDSGGTGLGLAIVKHIVQRHDGELSVDSQLSNGTKFCCRFPLQRLSFAGPSSGSE